MAFLREVGSWEAHQAWREVLDSDMAREGDVMISRHGQEIAALIPAQDYHAILDELEEIRLGRAAEELYESYLEDKESQKPYEEIRNEFLQD